MLSLEHLADLYTRHGDAARAQVQGFALGNRVFDFNRKPALLGVINLSPDSWYRESVCLSPDQAIRRGKVLHAQGADIVDIGAESTLAHAARQDASAQINQVVPIISNLCSAGVLVSVETYLPEVARACLEAGAQVINLTGADASGEIFECVAAHDAAVIICYVQGDNVREVGQFRFGDDPVDLMRDYFERQIERAQKHGVGKIVIDPGLGFYYENLRDSALRIRHQMRTFLNTFRLRTLGFPVCHALPHAFECFGEEVRSAEPFFAVLAGLGRTDFFRTHEVPKVKAVLDTLGLYDPSP